MPKTTKKAVTKKKPAAKKATKIVKKRTRKSTKKTVRNQSKEKFMFLLGMLIIITGAAIMIQVLQLSFQNVTVSFAPDLFLFTLTIVFLLLGIGIVANHAFYSKN